MSGVGALGASVGAGVEVAVGGAGTSVGMIIVGVGNGNGVDVGDGVGVNAGAQATNATLSNKTHDFIDFDRWHIGLLSRYRISMADPDTRQQNARPVAAERRVSCMAQVVGSRPIINPRNLPCLLSVYTRYWTLGFILSQSLVDFASDFHYAR
jgi:hypothetical protein